MNTYFFFSQACILLIASDALTNMLTLNSLFSTYSKKERFLLLVRENLFSLICMFCLYALALGTLHTLKTPVCATQAVGGTVITLTGMRAILGLNKDNWLSITSFPLSCVTPVATPLIIGPSWLAACFVLITRQCSLQSTSLILALSWFLISFVTITLLMCIEGKSKAKILLASQTILGLFATIIGSQMLISGLQLAFL